jgi:hypothetical protein
VAPTPRSSIRNHYAHRRLLTPAAQSSIELYRGFRTHATGLDGTRLAAADRIENSKIHTTTISAGNNTRHHAFIAGDDGHELALGEFHGMTGQLQSAGSEALAKTPRLLDARWALRRALLGLFILTVGIGAVAWLTHASIDPALEAVAAQSTP